MTMKEITLRMQGIAHELKRGLLSIFEAEKAMTEVILDGTLAMKGDTYEDNEKRIAAARKLKRRMWRMLLEATK